MDSPWRIELLGRLRATQGERVITHFRTQRASVLLAYLAYHRARPHPRGTLMELLWPEQRLGPARRSLSVELSWLRRQLEPGGERGDGEGKTEANPQTHPVSLPANDPPQTQLLSAFLLTDHLSVQLNPELVTTDVAEFEVALRAAERAAGSTERTARLIDAVELYGGELLPGFFDDWILQERQWLAERFFQSLSELLRLLEQEGDLQRALQYAHRGVMVDPLREEAHGDLIRLYAAAGQPTAALRQYYELERLLKEQLGTTPSHSTRTLARQLERLDAAARAEEPDALPIGAPSAAATADSSNSITQTKVVALLYRRHAQPDDQLLKLLETRLTARGHRVFVDRHLTVGVEWAREIERAVWGADAVIPLLSAAAVPSEMLAYEIQTAREAAQAQGGRPRLLPVRVNYLGPLPEPLAGILDPLEYALWEGPQDDESLVENLLSALHDPPSPLRRLSIQPGEPGSPVMPGPASSPRPADPWEKLGAVGGAVPLDSPYYVERPTDRRLHAAVAQRHSIVLIEGPRQMGKTSLLARGLEQARGAGARVVLTDFQMLDVADLESTERLFRAVGAWIADQLELEVFPDQVWMPALGASANLERYLRREVLGKIEAPIVWGLDEADRLFQYDYRSQVFGLFRSWHNRRGLEPAGVWSRLTLVLAYATEAHLFITDQNQSPFNVGTRFTLADLTLEQVSDLNGRFGSPLQGEEQVARYHGLTNGHPYLANRGLREMATEGLSLAVLEEQIDQDEGIFGDHLRRILVRLVKDADLCECVSELLRGGACPAEESFYRLRSAGVLRGGTPREAQLRNPLYAAYLARHLL